MAGPAASSWRARIFEFLELWIVSVRVASFGLVEFVRVARRYYVPLGFWKVDLLYLHHYLLHNPYRMSHRYIKREGSPGVPVYGETPLTTSAVLSSFARVSAKDHLVELGCGRGKGSIFFHMSTGCRVTGIEVIPEFVERAESIRTTLRLGGVRFVQGDLRAFDYRNADVLYFYGTTAEAPFIREVVERLRSTLRPGARVLSVSFALAEYDETNQLILVASVPAVFPWGETEAFLHVFRPRRATPSGSSGQVRNGHTESERGFDGLVAELTDGHEGPRDRVPDPRRSRSVRGRLLRRRRRG